MEALGGAEILVARFTMVLCGRVFGHSLTFGAVELHEGFEAKCLHRWPTVGHLPLKEYTSARPQTVWAGAYGKDLGGIWEASGGHNDYNIIETCKQSR